jgi:hypothetical protein
VPFYILDLPCQGSLQESSLNPNPVGNRPITRHKQLALSICIYSYVCVRPLDIFKSSFRHRRFQAHLFPRLSQTFTLTKREGLRRAFSILFPRCRPMQALLYQRSIFNQEVQFFTTFRRTTLQGFLGILSTTADTLAPARPRRSRPLVTPRCIQQDNAPLEPARQDQRKAVLLVRFPIVLSLLFALL